MKRVFILLLSILAIGLQAQSGFSFQASFKEKDGKPAANKKIPLRFTIQDPAAKAIYLSLIHIYRNRAPMGTRQTIGMVPFTSSRIQIRTNGIA